MKVDRTPPSPKTNLSLREEIFSVSEPTIEKIKMLYGEIGQDIFEGKTNISLNSGRKKSFWEKFLDKFTSIDYAYEEKDSLKEVVFKYICKNKFGTYKELETKFGQKGREITKIFELMGYFRV